MVNEPYKTELILFFHFMCVTANASELFCLAHLENTERFLDPSLTFHFKYQISYACKLASLSWRKSAQVREGAFSLGNE